MVEYSCKQCGKVFHKKSNHTAHINKKKPCSKARVKVINIEDIDKYINNNSCIGCKKHFVTKNNAIRHLKKSCKRISIKKTTTPNIDTNDNSSEDLNLDSDLMDLVNKIRNHVNYKDALKIFSDDITTTSSNSIINNNKNGNNIINNTIHNTTNVNIELKLCAFGEETKSGLTIPNDVFIKIMNRGFMSPVYMINFIHFNETMPQYQNVYLPSIKEGYVRVFNGDNWIVRKKSEVILELLQGKTDIILDKYEENKDSPEFLASIKRGDRGLKILFDIVDNEEDKRIIDIKSNIQEDLCNNKHLPVKTFKTIKR